MPAPLEEIFNAIKTLPFTPSWAPGERDTLTFVAPLEIEGVAMEGLQLRGICRRWLPDRAVSFQLESFPAKARPQAISRIDWKPLNPHGNTRGPKGMQRRVFHGTHHHSFGLNWIAGENRMRRRISVAEPIVPEPETYEELLAVVDREFRIQRLLGVLPKPVWELKLL